MSRETKVPVVQKPFRSFYDNLNNHGWLIFDVLSMKGERDRADDEPEVFISKHKDQVTILKRTGRGSVGSKLCILLVFLGKIEMAFGQKCISIN